MCVVLYKETFLLENSRQKALEDALLQSGQFKEALQALLDWLYKVEPQLTESQLVHGDLDTVTGLVEQHKVRVHLSIFGQAYRIKLRYDEPLETHVGLFGL